jgi:hypothetical protein
MTNPCEGQAAESALDEYTMEAERQLRHYTAAVSERNFHLIAYYRDALLAHIQRGAAPDGMALVPEQASEAMLRPFYKCPSDELQVAWQAAVLIAKKRTRAAALAPNHFRDAAEKVPAAWQVWCGLGNMQPYWPIFRTKGEAESAAEAIKTYTEVRPLWSHDSAARVADTDRRNGESVADRLSGYTCPCQNNEPAIREDKGDYVWRGVTR